MYDFRKLTDWSVALQWTPGGKGSFIVFQKFMQERLADFSTDRCKTDRNSTSFLSPHIHYGELSIRFIYYVVSGCGLIVKDLNTIAARESTRRKALDFSS